MRKRGRDERGGIISPFNTPRRHIYRLPELRDADNQHCDTGRGELSNGRVSAIWSVSSQKLSISGVPETRSELPAANHLRHQKYGWCNRKPIYLARYPAKKLHYHCVKLSPGLENRGIRRRQDGAPIRYQHHG